MTTERLDGGRRQRGRAWRRTGVVALTVVMSVGAFTTSALGVTPHGLSSSAPQRIGDCGSDPQTATSGSYVYVTSMDCGFLAIQVSRSTNDGRTFGAPVMVPRSLRTCSAASQCWFAQAPMITIGPRGLVYVAFMYGIGTFGDQYPVVDVSTNHGRTFKELALPPVPAATKAGTAYGDVDSIEVAKNGTIYLVWGYGPSGSEVTFQCLQGNSCAYLTGDFNIVVQRSTNGGKSWSAIQEVTPGYPDGGAVCASFVVQANGALDLLYNDFPTAPTTLDLSPATEYFTRSTDGGTVWSTPVQVGASAGTESPNEWWIEGDLAIDPQGDLLATWDTQTTTTDIGWLSVSTNDGASWSAPVQVTPTQTTTSAGSGEELMEATAVGHGIFDLAWQTKSSSGYSTFARTYSISGGFLTSAHEVSTTFGNPLVWPGDRVGLAAIPGSTRVDGVLPAFVAWGSATSSAFGFADTLGSVVRF